MRQTMSTRRVAAWVMTLAATQGMTAERADAQLANPSAAALGLAENYTAAARGFGAISWNPAGLAMPDNPSASFALSGRVLAGLDPIGLTELKDVEGQIVPASVKSEWLDAILAAGGEEGLAGVDFTLLALQWGRVGVQLSTTARVNARIGPEAAELILFGNAGRTGEVGDYSLAGSSLQAMAVSTGGISYAHPIIREPGRSLAVGATLKQSVGHVLISAADAGSLLRSDPLGVSIDFPIIHTDTASEASSLDSGRGVSLDLGAAWESGDLAAGFSVRNLINTFAWNEDVLLYRPGTATANIDSTSTDLDPVPFANAPQAVRDRLDDLGFAPVVAVGAAYRVHPQMRVSADLRGRLGESVLVGPKTHVGAGIELTPLHWLPLRAGGALVTGGHLLTVGVGLRLGPVRLAGSVAQNRGDYGEGTMAAFTLSAGGY